MVRWIKVAFSLRRKVTRSATDEVWGPLVVSHPGGSSMHLSEPMTRPQVSADYNANHAAQPTTPVIARLRRSRGNLRELVVRTNRRFTATNCLEISGLALRFCPALCLRKTKCLPSRCGRLPPPLAALPCGPRHPFGAPRNDNVGTAAQPINPVIARANGPWQSQGTDFTNQPAFYGNRLP